jgi:diguanylate cyclase (GGDEF)-like protein
VALVLVFANAVSVSLAVSFVWALAFAAPAVALDPDRLLTQYLRTVWQAEQGLPQSSVIALARTPDGYLWLGTQEGLVRFDGVRTVVFDRATAPALPHAMVFSLLVDRSDRLWVGTRRGLAWYEGGELRAVPPDAGLPDTRVSSLLEDAHGTLWVGTLGEGLYRADGGRFVAVAAEAVPGRRVRSLAEDGDGALWVATEAGLVRLDAGGATVFGTEDGIAGADLFDLLVDRQGRLWVGAETGLGRRRADGDWDLLTTADGLSSDRVRALAEDAEGNLWIGTEDGGLNRLAGGAFTVLNAARGLPVDSVQEVLADEEGNLWIGTSGGGLVRLQDGRFATFGVDEGVAAPVVRSIAETADGALWIGGGGLSRFSGGETRTWTTAQGLTSDIVTSLVEDQGSTLWVGTFGGGLLRWDVARWQDGPVEVVRAGAGLPSDNVNALLAARDGALWVGTDNAGLVRLAGSVSATDHRTDGATHFTTTDGLPGDSIQALYESRDGTLWVGTSEGLARLAGDPGDYTVEAWTTADGLPAPSLLAFHEAADGALWIGTAGDGLVRFASGRFEQLTVRQGLPNDAILALLDDGAGGLWGSTNRGIFRTTLVELEAALAGRRLVPQVFGIADGMRSEEGYGGTQPSALRDRRGRLWFATVRGAAVVDPRWRPPVAPTPTLLVESVAAAGVVLSHAPGSDASGAPSSGGSSAASNVASGALSSGSSSTPSSDPVRLPARARAVEIRYTATALRAPQRLRFRYRLEGHDEEWIDAGDRRTAFYSRLPGGEYTFRVTASLEGESAPLGEATTRLAVTPALHERSATRVGGVALLLAAAMGVHRLRTWRLRRRQHELEAIVDARTEELQQANSELERLAAVDGLTGIPNRRALDLALDRAWHEHRRRGAPLSFVLCDVDHFKTYNDTCGHPAGDAVLREVAATLAADCRRATDVAARYGGEEFAVLLPDTTVDDAASLAVSLLAAVRARRLPHPASPVADHVTMSVGVATVVPSGDLTPGDLTHRADEMLYRAKREGRNRVVAAGEEVASSRQREVGGAA